MRKSVFWIVLLLLSGCYKERPSFVVNSINVQHLLHEEYENNCISIEDIRRYIDHSETSNTKGIETLSIIPIIDKTQDTLLYIVNYSDGWVILSSDRRTPAEIASSPSGTISLNNNNRAFLSWLNSTAIDLKRIKESDDDELNFSKEEIHAHRSVWEKISGNRMVDPDIPITPGDDTLTLGDWVLYDTYYYYETYDSKEHTMVPEHWSQSFPYNNYCPLDNNGNHYYVGCAGVAAGALLHYFYRKNNYPSSFNGIPMDSIAVNYYDYNLNADSTDVTARYLRAVNDDMGLTVTINYWQGGTFAFPSQVSSFFSNHGYSCSYSSFDADIVKSNLLSQKPILMVAFDEWILNLANISEGHYFIIDGYELKRPVTAYYYVFVENGAIRPQYGERVVYEYGAPFVAHVTMNWGWSDQWTDNPQNDGWFTLTGSWATDNGTYDIFRHMFYNFQ